jgi:hypothetical protein
MLAAVYLSALRSLARQQYQNALHLLLIYSFVCLAIAKNETEPTVYVRVNIPHNAGTAIPL